MTPPAHVVRILSVLILASLAGCSDSDAPSQSSLQAASRNLVPADPQLAEIYNRSCRSCHTIAATGSPLTGDHAAWEERMQKGMGVLVDNVINGFGGMPPFGQCMDCDGDQFEALIIFMAEAK